MLWRSQLSAGRPVKQSQEDSFLADRGIKPVLATFYPLSKVKGTSVHWPAELVFWSFGEIQSLAWHQLKTGKLHHFCFAQQMDFDNKQFTPLSVLWWCTYVRRNMAWVSYLVLHSIASYHSHSLLVRKHAYTRSPPPPHPFRLIECSLSACLACRQWLCNSGLLMVRRLFAVQ